jgi:CheY-like chemotaxis protein
MTLSLSPGHEHLADSARGAEPLTAAEASELAQESPLTGIQIMVINTDSETCVHLQSLLGAAGATVICAYDVDAVLATIARTPPDLLLVDLDEPSASLHDAIRQVRLHERNKTLLTRLPAIALGVRGGSADVRTALQAGFDEHLAKPHSDAELVALVTDHVLRR